MHDVLTKEFAKGSVVQIVNPENAPSPVKLRSAHYHIGANLIAFSLASKAPVNVSLSMQLVKDATREVIMNSDRSLYVDESAVESGLKLHNSEFDNSQYGQALTILTRAAAKQFEMRVQQMNLSSSSQSKTTREKEPQGEVKKERRIASPF
jgi:hypothetical protein